LYSSASQDLTHYQFDIFAPYHHLLTIASSRNGGASKPPFASLNMNFTVGDSPETVVANRTRVCQSLDIQLTQIVAAKQTHSTNATIVTADDRGKGAYDWQSAIPDSDALITASPGVYLLMTFADCVPIVLFDPQHQALALIHAGWKGTLRGVADSAIRAMTRHFATEPRQLLATVGPAIGPCCYRIGEEVIRTAEEEGQPTAAIFTRRGEHTYLNLWQANRLRLLAAGLAEDNIEIANICTACHTELFFSHRAEQGQTGRFAVIAGLRG
jgi:YfiH family protein